MEWLHSFDSSAETILPGDILGTLLGYFYWQRGLEAAMLCHFTADVVAHFIWPLIR